MTALAPRLARRIDRLARRAHRFHRFAHHPLCGAYAGELVAIGRRTRVCRGCAYAAAGLGAGLALGLRWSVPERAVPLVAAAGCCLAALSLAVRMPKSVARLSPAALGGAALSGAVRAGGAHAVVLLLGIVCALAALVARYRARGPDRGPCATCPERLGPSPCSGFRAILRRERAFQRVARRWIDAG